jgi:hypothetical protein
VIVTNSTLTLLTPSPPPPPTLRGSSHFSYLVPYHRPVCRFAHGHTGVFHNNFLWYKLLALICIINPFLPLLLALLFCTFHTTLLCRFWEILFPALLLLHFLFNTPMPITYFEGIKHPCNFTGTRSLVLQGKGRWMMISDNGLQLSHRTISTSNFWNYSTFCIC